MEDIIRKFLSEVNNIDITGEDELDLSLRKFRVSLIDEKLFLDILVHCADKPVSDSALAKLIEIYNTHDKQSVNIFSDLFNVPNSRGTGKVPTEFNQ